MSTVRGFAPHLRRVTVSGLVLRTTASRDPWQRRQMIILSDSGVELIGSVPELLTVAATTLDGRRVQFVAVVDRKTGRFRYPEDGTILPPPHLDHTNR